MPKSAREMARIAQGSPAAPYQAVPVAPGFSACFIACFRNTGRILTVMLAGAAGIAAGQALAQDGRSPAGPAAAQIVAVQYSALKPPACTTSNKSRPEQRGEHELVPYRCAGPGGRIIRLDYHGVRVTLGLSSRNGRAGEGLVSAAYDIGPRMEWRGIRTGKGNSAAFTPHAAIVRLHARTDAGAVASVLAVLQIAGENLCVAAIADGPNANALARSHADRTAVSAPSALACPALPDLLGPGGAVAREMQAVNRR